ncbi:MAG: SRPBCC family protein [Pseudomonadota bacterium]
MRKTVAIEESTAIDAALEDVWKVSAHDFEHIDRWDANVRSSQQNGSPKSDAPVGGRVCNMYNGRETVENFVEYDESKHRFAYEITKGLPGFVISARNTWTHDAASPGKTRLTMNITMQVEGILGTLMQAPMKSQMGKVLRNAQEELKHYIETGRPHSRKLKKMKRD